MFKNAGQYNKALASLVVYLTGLVPIITNAHTWQPVVAYAVPGFLAVVSTYLFPNAPAQPPVVPPSA